MIPSLEAADMMLGVTASHSLLWLAEKITVTPLN